MSDVFHGVILGAAAAALGTIVAMKYLNRQPEGGTEPRQIAASSPTARDRRVVVQVPRVNDLWAAPVVQNTPITEAAYNMYPVTYAPGFGHDTNRPTEEVVLPV